MGVIVIFIVKYEIVIIVVFIVKYEIGEEDSGCNDWKNLLFIVT